MRRIETDVCIIGGGITAAMLAQKLFELRPDISIAVVEAGKRLFDVESRAQHRRRFLDYGENPWPGDYIEDQSAKGVISRTMAAGGSALHWGGTCNRFSEEDLRLRSMYGLAVDWPIEWKELEKFYCEAERRLGVSGEPSPLPEDWRSEPYPPACIRCNTCSICPTGARYSPDFTFRDLLARKNFQLHDQTLIRKLIAGDAKPAIVAAQGVHTGQPDEEVEYRAPLFVLASGYCWSPHLLLLSRSSRYPNGLANRSGLVGRYMCGHAFHSAMIEIDAKIYPGMNETHALISRQFFRSKPDQPFIRHDLRIWESASGREPRLRDGKGEILLGDDLLADWRRRAERGSARVRGYYDVHPDRDSSLTLDDNAHNRWGDPLPKIEHRLDAATRARQAHTDEHFRGIFARLAQANNGKILSASASRYLDHPEGGCRMGTDPSGSVCDSYGQTHGHENLFVAGSPTLPTAGCTNGTLTFVALTLRSAERIAERYRL